MINFYLFGLQESGSVCFNGGQDTSVSYILTHLGYNVDNVRVVLFVSSMIKEQIHF